MKYLGGKLFILAISHDIALTTHVPTMKKNMIEHFYHLINQFYIWPVLFCVLNPYGYALISFTG